MVTRLRTGQVGDRGFIPDKGKSFPFPHTIQTGSVAKQTFNSVGTGVFSGDKVAGA
jgi:hypothetical protein